MQQGLQHLIRQALWMDMVSAAQQLCAEAANAGGRSCMNRSSRYSFFNPKLHSLRTARCSYSDHAAHADVIPFQLLGICVSPLLEVRGCRLL